MLNENDTTAGENLSVDANIQTYLKLFPENGEIHKLVREIDGLSHLNEAELKELYVLTIALLFKEQNRNNHRQLIASTENTITIWSDAAKKAQSISDKLKIAGIIEKFNLDLQSQKLRSNQAVREVEQANRNLDLFKVRISLAKPKARSGLEEYRIRLAAILSNMPATEDSVVS